MSRLARIYATPAWAYDGALPDALEALGLMLEWIGEAVEKIEALRLSPGKESA